MGRRSMRSCHRISLSECGCIERELGNEGRLTLTFNEGLVMEAGLFVGMSIGFGLNASLQVYGPKTWFKPWTLAWHDAFAIDLV